MFFEIEIFLYSAHEVKFHYRFVLGFYVVWITSI